VRKKNGGAKEKRYSWEYLEYILTGFTGGGSNATLIQRRKTVVEKSVLMKEIDSLPSRYYGEVVDFVGYIKEKKARESISLEKAAEMAAEEYYNNKELTSFCALDGEDFHETR